MCFEVLDAWGDEDKWSKLACKGDGTQSPHCLERLVEQELERYRTVGGVRVRYYSSHPSHSKEPYIE